MMNPYRSVSFARPALQFMIIGILYQGMKRYKVEHLRNVTGYAAISGVAQILSPKAHDKIGQPTLGNVALDLTSLVAIGFSISHLKTSWDVQWRVGGILAAAQLMSSHMGVATLYGDISKAQSREEIQELVQWFKDHEDLLSQEGKEEVITLLYCRGYFISPEALGDTQPLFGGLSTQKQVQARLRCYHLALSNDKERASLRRDLHEAIKTLPTEWEQAQARMQLLRHEKVHGKLPENLMYDVYTLLGQEPSEDFVNATSESFRDEFFVSFLEGTSRESMVKQFNGFKKSSNEKFHEWHSVKFQEILDSKFLKSLFDDLEKIIESKTLETLKRQERDSDKFKAIFDPEFQKNLFEELEKVLSSGELPSIECDKWKLDELKKLVDSEFQENLFEQFENKVTLEDLKSSDIFKSISDSRVKKSIQNGWMKAFLEQHKKSQLTLEEFRGIFNSEFQDLVITELEKSRFHRKVKFKKGHQWNLDLFKNMSDSQVEEPLSNGLNWLLSLRKLAQPVGDEWSLERLREMLELDFEEKIIVQELEKIKFYEAENFEKDYGWDLDIIKSMKGKEWRSNIFKNISSSKFEKSPFDKLIDVLALRKLAHIKGHDWNLIVLNHILYHQFQESIPNELKQTDAFMKWAVPHIKHQIINGAKKFSVAEFRYWLAKGHKGAPSKKLMDWTFSLIKDHLADELQKWVTEDLKCMSVEKFEEWAGKEYPEAMSDGVMKQVFIFLTERAAIEVGDWIMQMKAKDFSSWALKEHLGVSYEDFEGMTSEEYHDWFSNFFQEKFDSRLDFLEEKGFKKWTSEDFRSADRKNPREDFKKIVHKEFEKWTATSFGGLTAEQFREWAAWLREIR